MKENYPKAYTEVLEILKYMPEDEVKKIPQNLIDTFEYKKDDTYVFKIDENKDFSELEILDETEAIMINIFTDYWATVEQKEKILSKQKYDNEKIEEEKRNKYNAEDLFNNNTKVGGSSSNLPIEYKRTFFQKFLDYIKRIFKI